MDSGDAYDAFIRLRERYGGDAVCLLESVGGPAADNQSALVAVCPVFGIEIRDARITMRGIPELVEHMSGELRGRSDLRASGDGYLLRRRRDVWDVLRFVQSRFTIVGVDAGSFGFGFLAVITYEAVSYIEDFEFPAAGPGDVPDMAFRVYATSIEFDLAASRAIVRQSRGPYWCGPDIEDIVELLQAVAPASESGSIEAPAAQASPRLTMDEEEYLDRARRALGHIHVGDIYQVQIGHEISVELNGGELDVYRRMRSDNPSPYMAFIPLDGHTILSGSPELHVRIQHEELTMRPIAGTCRREHDPERDEAGKAWLQSNEKEVAEHVMLVDLCRNDLGRVARPGSVDVPDLMLIEEYSHVFHLVSTVIAQLEPGNDVYDVIQATFPAGTMTGTPKIRAMEIIQDLEKTRRGIYAGIFGVIGFGGCANLALSIRSIVSGAGRCTMRASAGIVVDSSPESEWRETLSKMGSAARALTGRDLL